MKEGFFEDRGIYYRTNDFRPDRETIVFVHGLSGSSSSWFPYEKKFGDDYNILTFDLRGHGKSLKPKRYEDYEIKKMSEDLVELLGYLKIRRFIMVSHSLASLIALEFLTHHMERVSSAVFLSPSYYARARTVAKFTDHLLRLSQYLPLFPYTKGPTGHVDYTRYHNSSDWDLLRTIADVRNTSLRVYLFCSEQALRVNYENFVPQINMPVLLVHGEKDTIFPFANSISMHKKIKGSVLTLLPHADHIIVINYFDEVSKHINQFLKTRQ